MSRIQTDEQLVFFPTVARLSDDSQSWHVPVHGWVFEPETNSRLRAATIGVFRRALRLESNEASAELLRHRMQFFLVDNERGKRIGVRVGDQDYRLGESSADGHIRQSIQIPVATVAPRLAGSLLVFRAINSADDGRTFDGHSYCLPPVGISVVSDIDDTIKQSNVLDKRELLRNTFLREFRAIDGMSTTYTRWAAAGASFHFVSASPWQLYEPLDEWTRQAGFPGSSFHLRPFRLKDSSLLAMFGDPLSFKLAAIEPLLQSFPQREFILVGDSGEKDPEIYGELARRHARQVIRIYIRDITHEPAGGPRYAKAFADVAPEVWQLFDDASQLQLPGD